MKKKLSLKEKWFAYKGWTKSHCKMFSHYKIVTDGENVKIKYRNITLPYNITAEYQDGWNGGHGFKTWNVNTNRSNGVNVRDLKKRKVGNIYEVMDHIIDRDYGQGRHGDNIYTLEEVLEKMVSDEFHVRVCGANDDRKYRENLPGTFLQGGSLMLDTKDITREDIVERVHFIEEYCNVWYTGIKYSIRKEQDAVEIKIDNKMQEQNALKKLVQSV